MQKIVIDTNVLVSALITKGFPSKIFDDLIFEKKVLICLSPEVWNEYLEVLSREKFSRYLTFKTNSEIVVSKLEDLALYYQPDLEIDAIKDESDNKFLELAVFAKADFLITGNTLDFEFHEFENVKIMTPRDYWENYKPD